MGGLLVNNLEQAVANQLCQKLSSMLFRALGGNSEFAGQVFADYPHRCACKSVPPDTMPDGIRCKNTASPNVKQH
jgi:hypothetical protein